MGLPRSTFYDAPVRVSMMPRSLAGCRRSATSSRLTAIAASAPSSIMSATRARDLVVDSPNQL